MYDLRHYQKSAIAKLRRKIEAGLKRVVLVSPTGCHAKGTPILIADGTLKPVEKVKVGDRLIGDDGGYRTVTETHCGDQEMVRITPVKGTPFDVNIDHILSLVHTSTGVVTDVSVRDYIKWNNHQKHLYKLFRSGEIEFECEAVDLPIHPWLLGVLIGDGCLTSGCEVSNPEKAIQDRVILLATDVKGKVVADGRCEKVSLTNPRGQGNPLIQKLRSLGLHGKNAYGKFIPDIYKTASIENRYHLLAGLLDTDGHLTHGHYDWISASEQLADDFCFVARSLGFAAYKSPCQKYCQNGGGGTYYRVSLSGDFSKMPTVKHPAFARGQIKSVLRTGFKVERIGLGEYYGFEVDGNHRYLMGDFTVTHNSGKTRMAAEIIRLACEKGHRVAFICNRIELCTQAIEAFAKVGITAGLMQGNNSWNCGAQVVVCSIQTMARRKYLGFDVALIDECFSGDTLVSTPTGEKRIDLLCSGDIVYNQIGTGVVQSVQVRSSKTLYRLEFSDGRTTECTGNHPFFTSRGWIKAQELEVGDCFYGEQGMRLLWESVSPVGEDGRKWENHFNLPEEVVGKAEYLLKTLWDEAGEPDVKSGNKSEDESKIKRDSASSYKAWRERAIASLATACFATRARRGVGGRIYTENMEEARGWLSSSLQDRYSKRIINDCHRDRRGIALAIGEEGARQKENGATYFPRLVSISVVERESAEPVYNLHVSGHPSYFANGKLVHNCHTTPQSKAFRKFFESHSNIVIIGLTATPWAPGMAARHKWLHDEPIWQDLIVAASIPALIEAKFLVDVTVWAPCDPDLTGVKIQNGDYEKESLGLAMSKPKLVGDIVQHWLKLGEGRPTVCFCVNVKHSMHVVEEFRKAGVRAEHVDGYMTEDVRRPIINRFKAGEIDVLSNCHLLSVGFDHPPASCAILARPTRSQIAYIQTIGRILRPSEGKTHGLILDHAGVVQRLGWPTDELPYTLDADDKKKESKESEKPLPIVCPSCYAVRPRSKKLCDCGFVPVATAKPQETLSGELVKLSRKQAKQYDMKQKQEIYSALIGHCRERGMRDGAAYYKFRDMVGVHPCNSLKKEPGPMIPQVESWIKHQQIKWANSRDNPLRKAA